MMTRYILLCAGISMLAACQNADTAADESASGDDEAMNSVQEGEADSEPVLAERSVEGIENIGADLTTGDGVDDEKNDDINIPPATRYITYYLGTYGPSGECTGSKALLELEERSVSYGTTKCQIENISADGNGINISTTACMTDNKASADREYSLDISELGEIRMTDPKSTTLKRCGAD